MPSSVYGSSAATWQERLEEKCREAQIHSPVFQIISDRRGGRTAWSSTVTVQGQNINARYWYDAQYINNSKEDAAEVALKRLIGMSHNTTNEMQPEKQKEPPGLMEVPILRRLGPPALEDWESQKELIHRLYNIESFSLAAVRETLSLECGCTVSLRQLRANIEKWGFTKHVPENFPKKARERSSSFGKKTVPRTSTTFAVNAAPVADVGMAHKPTGSLSPARALPAHLSFARSVIERARSRSELSQQDKISTVGIVDLWRRQGGPPVPNLSSHPLEVEASQPRAEVYDQGEDDYDDDQQGDENDVDIKPEQQSEPIVPTYVPMTFRRSDYMSRSALEEQGFCRFDEDLGKQQGIDVKGDMPFTDSGYNSTPNVEHPLNVQPALERSPHQLNVDSSSARGDGSNYDVKTLYSIGTTVNLAHAQNYIIELSKDIYSRLCRFVDTKNWNVLSKVLPELTKAFAIKLYHDAPSEVNRKIMHFIHKRHQEIIAQLEVMFNHDEEDEPDRTQGHLGDMSLLDKMGMWNSKVGEDYSVHPNEDLFEGVKDNEDDLMDQSELSVYHNIIVDSPAYEWFLSKLAKESVLQLGIPELRIRQQILDRLPTGTISKRRSPNIYEVTINLDWHYTMEERLRHELSEGSKYPVQLFQPSIIVTGSPQEAQGLTIRQYLAQTWPMTGLQILDALEKATTSFARYSHVSYLGDTQLETRILFSHLIVTATGPAYFVADCGEVLAWIGSALLSNTQNLTTSCLPLITSFRVDTGPSDSTFLKYKGYCNINFDITQLRTSDESLPAIQNISRDLLGGNTFISGFPIRRQPEGYSGLELSFNTLLLYLQAPKAETFHPRVFIKGAKGLVQLVKHTDNVFLWQLHHLLPDSSSCRADHYSKLDVEAYGPLEHHVLEAGRHIISKFVDDTAPAEDSHCISEELGLVNIKIYPQSRSLSETDPPYDPEFSSRNLTAAQNNKTLSTLSVSQNDEPALESPGIESVPSALENDQWGLCTELILNGSTIGSPEDSLDSDMISISNSSEHIEPLNSQELLYPLLNDILHHLLSEFRNTTQCQSSPGQGGGSSGAFSSTTDASHTRQTLRPSQKRNRPQEEEDNNSGEDSHLPPPKKLESSEGEKPQKSFACPYLKWDPIKYSRCCVNVKKLSRISDVKQHLIRKHTPKRYCQVCQATNFPDIKSLQNHIDIRKCARRDPGMLIGISYEQRDQLHRKSKTKDGDYSAEDQWFAIWEILFPGHRRPSSVYMDTDLTREMHQLREHFTRRGPAIMREYLESDPAWRGFEITDEQRGVYLERVIAQGFNTWFEDWLSNNSSASTTAERQSSSNMQDSGYESPMSWIVGSGVAMEGQSSFSETGYERCELPPAFGIPPVDFNSQPGAVRTRVRSTPPAENVSTAPSPTDVPHRPYNFGSVAGGQEGDQVDDFEPGLNDVLDFQFVVDAFPRFGDIEGS